MRKRCSIILSLLLLVTGCAHWIGDKSRALADPSITFEQLRENPEAYRGKLVLLGGTVEAVTQTEEGTTLEIQEHKLDSRELPDVVIPSRGRFLSISSGVLDPAKYQRGALVTMMGEVAGKRIHPLHGVEYSYPVIAVREIHAIELPEPHPEYDYGDGHRFFFRRGR
jgi:outer membrane lipoprotein